MVIFIDFEASSLSQSSWPIEAGIARIEPDGRIVAEARLIRPHADWPEDDWSAVSAHVHNIPRAALDAAEPAEAVARWLIYRIGRTTPVSDAPEFDQRWLDRLTATVGGAP